MWNRKPSSTTLLPRLFESSFTTFSPNWTEIKIMDYFIFSIKMERTKEMDYFHSLVFFVRSSLAEASFPSLSLSLSLLTICCLLLVRKCSALRMCMSPLYSLGSLVFFIFIMDFYFVFSFEKLLSSNSNGICRRAACQPVKLSREREREKRTKLQQHST